MILPGMAKDDVVLVKADGKRIEGLKAVVSMRRIVTFHTDVEIEPKDMMIKQCADGEQEAYLVLDPMFNHAGDGIPENYQITVRKVAVPE
ncbi:hypothetical protein [Maridesulfovibrio salexigens]|uniref:Uncharacterized protein n=1 Tax=Maridesulfovibrio salexigens (strain ATCC 14822 / DSM 2638 / NCIMB 8403 / VKM B-1763) TaxID=526222 RepID=C6BVV9_MARSD|nr:hypothetical protein [Maridesulfovibrio salexigens]ACS80162.1 conserved hypothetical protein [Maridesulfovibrio salexigens DSM 2638]